MVTLDIDDSCIRVMVCSGKRVEVAASLPLEPGLVEDGVVVNKVTVAQRLSELMAINGVTEKQVVVSVSGVHSLYRVATLPQLPKGMLAEAVRREMERVMPVPLSELYTAWQSVSVLDIETVCMVGLPRNTMDSILEVLHEAGLEPQAMDIRPLALARVADEKDAIVIGVQPTSFDIVVIIDGIPELLRSLPFPTRDISLSDKVAVVKEELDRTVTFYNSSHKENSITTDMVAFVNGDLREMLVEALDYPVKVLPDFLSYPEGFDSSEYAVNIGLALGRIKVSASRVRVSINIIPEAYLPKPRSVIGIVSWVFVVVAIAVLVPLAVLTVQSVSDTLTLRSQVNSARKQIEARQGTQVMLGKLQAELDEVKSVRDVFQQPLDGFEAQRARVNGHLSKVTSLLPGTVDLESVGYSEKCEIEEEKGVSLFTKEKIKTYVRVQVVGTAPDEDTILSYCRSLRDTGRFSGVLVWNMEEEEYNKWKFTIVLDVSDIEGGE